MYPTTSGHIELGSVSPRSINGIDPNSSGLTSTPFGFMTNSMPIQTMHMFDNYNNNVTVGGVMINTVNSAPVMSILPALPAAPIDPIDGDINTGDTDNEESETDGNDDNGLYGRQITETAGGGPDVGLYGRMNSESAVNTPQMPQKITQSCDGCNTFADMVNGGRVDESDGKFYCNECWNGFYE
eukprot:202042_1